MDINWNTGDSIFTWVESDGKPTFFTVRVPPNLNYSACFSEISAQLKFLLHKHLSHSAA